MNIDLNLVYMVLGVIATIIVGYLGIKYSYKNKVKTSLLYFENNCVSLFKSVVKDLDELEIRYKGKTVNENLITYKGTFFNSGNVDIDKNLMHKPVTVILPDDYEWKKVVLIDKSEDVNIDLVEKTNEVEFSWDILKENEFFTFDSVIEYKPKSSSEDNSQRAISNITRYLSRNISFSQRITNLKSIDIEQLPSKPLGKFEFIFFILMTFGLVILGLYWSIGQFAYPDYKITHEIRMDSIKSYVSIKSCDKNEIQIIDSLGNRSYMKIYNQSSQPHFTGNIKIVKDNLSYWGLIGGSLFALLFGFMLVLVTNSLIADRRLYNKVKQIADKYDNSDFPERLSPRTLYPFE